VEEKQESAWYKGTKWFGLSSAAIVCVVLVIMGIAIGVPYLVNYWSEQTANVRGETGVREDTVANADFRFGTYTQYYNLCQTAQSAQQKLKIAQDSPDNPQQDLNIQALNNQYTEAVTKYNSLSAQEARTPFKAANLPHTINIDPTEEQVTCGTD